MSEKNHINLEKNFIISIIFICFAIIVLLIAQHFVAQRAEKRGIAEKYKITKEQIHRIAYEKGISIFEAETEFKKLKILKRETKNKVQKIANEQGITIEEATTKFKKDNAGYGGITETLIDEAVNEPLSVKKVSLWERITVDRWEYTVYTPDPDFEKNMPLILNKLNEMGNQGWELVSINAHNGSWIGTAYYVFKRRL